MSDLFEAADTFRMAQIHKLQAELAKANERLSYLIDSEAIVVRYPRKERSALFWLVFPDGESQSDIHSSAIEAIDAAIESERGNG